MALNYSPYYWERAMLINALFEFSQAEFTKPNANETELNGAVVEKAWYSKQYVSRINGFCIVGSQLR